MRFDPGQTEQAEQAEAPRHGPQRELSGVRRTRGPCPSARGISCTVTWRRRTSGRSSSMAQALEPRRAGEDVDVHRAGFGPGVKDRVRLGQDQDAGQAGAGKVVRQASRRPSRRRSPGRARKSPRRPRGSERSSPCTPRGRLSRALAAPGDSSRCGKANAPAPPRLSRSEQFGPPRESTVALCSSFREVGP